MPFRIHTRQASSLQITEHGGTDLTVDEGPLLGRLGRCSALQCIQEFFTLLLVSTRRVVFRRAVRRLLPPAVPALRPAADASAAFAAGPVTVEPPPAVEPAVASVWMRGAVAALLCLTTLLLWMRRAAAWKLGGPPPRGRVIKKVTTLGTSTSAAGTNKVLQCQHERHAFRKYFICRIHSHCISPKFNNLPHILPPEGKK